MACEPGWEVTMYNKQILAKTMSSCLLANSTGETTVSQLFQGGGDKVPRLNPQASTNLALSFSTDKHGTRTRERLTNRSVKQTDHRWYLSL